MSNVYILKHKSPSIDPWGTPDSIFDHVLKDEFILILCHGLTNNYTYKVYRVISEAICLELRALRALPIINTRLRVFTLINTCLNVNLHQAIFACLSPSALSWVCTVYQLCNNGTIHLHFFWTLVCTLTSIALFKPINLSFSMICLSQNKEHKKECKVKRQIQITLFLMKTMIFIPLQNWGLP